jgi:hypothetical protein
VVGRSFKASALLGCFDRDSLGENRSLVFGLPPLVIAFVAFLMASAGLWAVTTIYLYWQWYHYARQPWGIAQAYRRKAGQKISRPWLEQVVFYAIPLAGVFWRSAQEPTAFLGLDVRFLPVPVWLAEFSLWAALAIMVFWLLYRLATRELPRTLGHSLFLASHWLIFGVSYIVIDNINHGWLVINIWHNA